MATMVTVYTDVEIRSVIRFLWAKNSTPSAIHVELRTVYGNEVMSVQSVRKWCRAFPDGRTDVLR